MNTLYRAKKKWVRLDPGDYFVTERDLVISTLLGSCVSVCLRDPVNKISGMNHFLLSNRRYSKNIPICLTDAGRYGVNSMELVLNRMYRLGAKKKYLQAKAFGGGNVLKMSDQVSTFFYVGSVNVTFIKEFLKMEGIPLVASALGGEVGRLIRFVTEDFSVYVKNIGQMNTSRIVKRDRVYWEKSIKEQEEEKSGPKNVDLW